MLCLRVGSLRSRRLTLFTWSNKDIKIKLRWLLVMELMMLLWYYKHMLASVFSERRASKLPEVPTMQLDNSRTWRLCCFSTVEKLTGGTPIRFFTHTTRISCMSSRNSTLAFTRASLGRCSTMASCINHTICVWLLSRSCGSPALTLRRRGAQEPNMARRSMTKIT